MGSMSFVFENGGFHVDASGGGAFAGVSVEYGGAFDLAGGPFEFGGGEPDGLGVGIGREGSPEGITGLLDLTAEPALLRPRQPKDLATRQSGRRRPQDFVQRVWRAVTTLEIDGPRPQG